ncbi:MAG: hypothetical protein MJZ15_11485 [Bacteroidales bacterium]|nr:hypothetical protein [Bacteroidales bacterium]
MSRQIIILIFALVALTASAQKTVIEGTVLDAQGKKVDAYITVAPKGTGIILGFADTDAKGHYKLEFTSQADSMTVTASGLAIGNQVKIVANRSQRVDFRVREKTVQLKEVSVRAQKIRQNGDTLNYLVGAYQQQGDRVIGDVLKRMPGIEVSQSGGIKFNGKSISKFYVEDMDLLQGRYGLATNNINASDVATVQVLENHQPVKALQGKTLTDDVAINLKLKDSAKGTVAINTMLGGGIQQACGWHIGSRPLTDDKIVIGQNPLWTAEVVGMYFAKRRQNMTLYKGNNTGDDVSAELTQHYSGINSVGLYPFCPTGAVMPSGSGLPQKRTFDNHSHILTMNHLEKVFKDSEIGINVAYHNDRIRREGSSVGDQFISDDSRLLTSETMTSETKINNLNIQARYNWNASNGFLANVLKFDTNWNSDRVDGLFSSERTGAAPVNYGNDRVRQHFDRPQLSVSNTFNTIRNLGKNTFDLHFSAGYSQRPNTLTVGIDSLLQGTSTAYQQDVTSHHIVGDFHTNYDFRFGAFTLNYGVVAHASLHGIETDLNGFDTGNYSSRNDLWYNTYELVLGQHYKYEKGRWRLSLGCPLNLYTQTLDDRIRDDCHSYVHLLVTPTFSVNYEWRDWTANANANYSKTVGDPGGIYSGYIMNNYRSFQRSYVEQLSETDRMGASASIGYRSALAATFFRINGSYSHTRDNQIYGTVYQGATSVVQAVDQRTEADSYSLSFDGSKGFDWLQSTLRTFGSYGYSTSERLIGGTVYPFHSRSISVGAGGTITPLPWLNFVLSSGYSWNISQTNGNSDKLAQTVRSATQRLKVNVYVTKQLTLAATVEDNYNNLTAENRHAWFGDATAKLKLKHIDLELKLNNLFDQRQYTRVNYSGLDIYTQTSQLRPRNIVASVRFKLL